MKWSWLVLGFFIGLQDIAFARASHCKETLRAAKVAENLRSQSKQRRLQALLDFMELDPRVQVIALDGLFDLALQTQLDPKRLEERSATERAIELLKHDWMHSTEPAELWSAFDKHYGRFRSLIEVSFASTPDPRSLRDALGQTYLRFDRYLYFYAAELWISRRFQSAHSLWETNEFKDSLFKTLMEATQGLANDGLTGSTQRKEFRESLTELTQRAERVINDFIGEAYQITQSHGRLRLTQPSAPIDFQTFEKNARKEIESLIPYIVRHARKELKNAIKKGEITYVEDVLFRGALELSQGSWLGLSQNEEIRRLLIALGAK